MRHMNKQSWMVFMTITQLQVFVEVAQTKSFTKAAKNMDLSINLCKLKPDVPGHSLAEKNHQLI